MASKVEVSRGWGRITEGASARRRAHGPRPGWRGLPVLRGLNWGMLVLFLLFTSVLGVERAEAKIDWRAVGSCAGACAALFANISSSLVCSGCLVAAGVVISDVVFRDVEPYGWGCAKASIGC